MKCHWCKLLEKLTSVSNKLPNAYESPFVKEIYFIYMIECLSLLPHHTE